MYFVGQFLIASIRGFLAIALAGFLASPIWANETNTEDGPKIIETYIADFDLEMYEATVAGHDIFDLNSWENMDLIRHSLEMLVFNVAPILGGCDCEIVMKPYTVATPHVRSIEEVRSGLVVSHPVASFTDDSRVQDGVYLSQSILNPEDFYVGLYTSKNRDDLLTTTKFEDLSNLRFIAARSWEIDNLLLEVNDLKPILGDTWENMLAMIDASRADVIMQPFTSAADLGFNDPSNETRFVPIPDVKMAFPQGRNYIVSNSHPDGVEFLEALNRGIAMLHEDDFLRRAHEWAGVINPVTEEYEVFGVTSMP